MRSPAEEAAAAYAMSRLKDLTPYMSDKEREKLVRENRSETYTTAYDAWSAGHAAAISSPEVLALVEAAKKAHEWIRLNHEMPLYSEMLSDFTEALSAFAKQSGGSGG